MTRVLKWLIASILLFALLVGLILLVSPKARKAAQLKALDKIGDVATDKMASNPDAEGTVAADFINIPIEAREIGPDIYQATGVGNAHMIKTDEGHIIFDTGLPTQVVKQINALKPYMDDLEPTHIVVSHSHADHSGGVKAWYTKGMDIVAHEEFEEEQRYLTELQDYQWFRNRTLFPFMPEKPPTMGLIAYGGIEPTMRVRNGEPLKFTQGGRDFEFHALPGAEGNDNLVLWMPKERMLFAGDFFGPIFPQFPNVFTMRGEKIRKPIEYVQSLEVIMELDPLIIVPSHRNPVTDKNTIDEGLRRMHGATKFVHDAVVAGMNEGKTLEQLMVEISLPESLDLSQEHGKVSWAVKSIWEYYMTWFHFDKTTELYHVPRDAVNADIIELAGAENLVAKARGYMDGGEPLKALHLLDIAGASGGDEALILREGALETLLAEAKSTTNNSYEIYWLEYRLRDTRERLNPLENAPE
ncbi:MAG: MBL fold metallo-hydrolase [Hellea sp.]|nr:MBL fold metallo-hydrolase [Hellea sp.]